MKDAFNTAMALLALLGLTIACVFGALVGAGLSLMAMDRATATTRTRASTFCSGLALSLVVTPAVASYYELKPTVTGAIAMVLALYGMAILLEGFALIKNGTVRGAIEGLIKKWSGT